MHDLPSRHLRPLIHAEVYVSFFIFLLSLFFLVLPITSEFSISFSYVPMKHEIQHELGLAHDLGHFHFLVSFLL
jgi:hypothetical protein